jgi:hypothetical protein
MVRQSSAWAAGIVAAGLLVSAEGQAQEYYSDVRPVLVESCTMCHTADGISWSMDDAEATYEQHRRIARAVTSGNMPPWIAEAGHQQYMDDLSLGDDVIALIAAWRDAGFPKGSPRPDAEPSRSVMAFTPDVSIDIMDGQSYLPTQNRDDDYRCFVAEWTGEEPVYLTGFRAVPGNPNVAHHVVVHAVDPEMTDRFKELDAEEEGLGYQCFGGALPDRLDQESYEARYPDGVRELLRSEWWLAHWAPGMNGHSFPEGTGILLEPGAGLVVQMHYYTKVAPGESDAGTRLDFEVAETVDQPAFHLVQTRNDWLGGPDGTMVIPPDRLVSYEMGVSLEDMVPLGARIAGVDAARIEGFDVHSANLHMHAFGHSGDVTLVHDSGRRETLLSIPRWDLHWQRDFAFVEPKVFAREQLEDVRIRVRCTYLNETDAVVYGGLGSYDEMCFNFSYVALKVSEQATDETDPTR